MLRSLIAQHSLKLRNNIGTSLHGARPLSYVRSSNTVLIRGLPLKANNGSRRSAVNFVAPTGFAHFSTDRGLAVDSNRPAEMSHTPINQAPHTAGGPEKVPSGGEAKFARLPEDVYPINYNLRLQPFLDEFKFTGELVVDVEIRKSTKDIVLDAHDINIKTASIVIGGDNQQNGSSKSSKNGTQQAERIEYIKKPIERVRLSFADSLPKGQKAQLFITYEGILQEKMYGFYRNKYTNQAGEEKWGATTQMEACHARKCLPCWDEPAVKATFDCTLVVPKHLCALGNMPVIKEEPVKWTDGSEWKAVTYDRTPKMSTYLLAFCIGEYDYVEDKTSNGTLVRVYTPKGKAHQGKFSLDFTLKTLPYYEEFFNVRFPLPKVDLVAIENFAMGAMENWGLITFRETAVLSDPTKSSAAARQRVALVVGHELAHMWFGNLVTMEWWTDLWLNEGFATFVEHLSIENSFPEWEIWKQFVEDIVISAMHLDALQSTHPIQVPVNHPDEVEEIFDQISYEKGASVIRMLYMYLGHDGFRAGLGQYLAAFQYRNAKTDDLWAHLEKATNKPVSKVMSDWTKKIGFPYLMAELESGQDKLRLTQRRFTFLPSKDHSNALWHIPVTIQLGGDKYVQTLIEQVEHVSVPLGQPIDRITPVVVNSGRTGFYRVAYSKELQSRLIPAIQNKQLSAVDRLAIQNDQYALARAGIQPLSSYLALIHSAFAPAEDDPVVWQAIVVHLGGIQALLEGTPVIGMYKEFVRQTLKNIADKLGWEPKPDETHLQTMLREQVLMRLVRAEHAHHVDRAYAMLKQYGDGLVASGGKSDVAGLQPELRYPVFSAGALKGQDGHKLLRDVFSKSDMQEERVRVLANMGYTQDLQILNDMLNWSLDTTEVRPQDLVILYGGCTSRPHNRDAVWKFLTTNWERFMKVTPESLVARTMNAIVSGMVDEAKINDVEAFFVKNPLDQGKRAIQQACEKIKINHGMLQRDLQSTEKWLAETIGQSQQQQQQATMTA